jgi:Xanthine/uracil permeases
MAKFEDEIFKRSVEPELDVHDRPKFFQGLLLSSQHLFAMFGATVLVPFLTGLPVSAALIASGIGTLLYILITKGQIPAYLGSSFAFILPITIALGANSLGEVLTALFFSGVLYVIIGLVIRLAGTGWIITLLPPIVVGPVIMVIGLGLAPVAVDMAMYTDSGNQEGYSMIYITVALITLVITILASIFLKGVLGLIPILIGIIGGYISALMFGIVDLELIKSTGWFVLPDLYIPYKDYTPAMNIGLFMVMLPIVFVTISEHIGHQIVINKIVGRNFFKKPGLHRSIIGDGVATMFASTIGGRRQRLTVKTSVFLRLREFSVSGSSAERQYLQSYSALSVNLRLSSRVSRRRLWAVCRFCCLELSHQAASGCWSTQKLILITNAIWLSHL